MAEYTTQDVARLLALSVSKVRSFARAGFITADRDRRGKYRFSFQDVVLLRTARELSQAAIPPHQIYRTLRNLKAQLPAGAPLSSVRVVVDHDDVLVQDQHAVWRPKSGQAQLDFSIGDIASQVVPLVRAQAAEQKPDISGDGWFDLGLDFDMAGAVEDAKAAYRRALELNPKHSSAHTNLGRLLQEEGKKADAEAHYRQALSVEPDNATATSVRC